MSYKGPGVENVNKLIYPCPSVSLDSLGTHLVSPDCRVTGAHVRAKPVAKHVSLLKHC